MTAREQGQRMARNIPVEIVFNPNWWYRHYGISFEQPFYFDRLTRIQNDVKMRQALHDRFGMGHRDPQARPIVGSMHVAGGFVLPALFGVEIRFAPGEAPWPLPANLAAKDVRALRPPDFRTSWPMKQWIEDMDSLEKEFGYVVGDFDTDGILNTALQIRGQELYTDLLEDPVSPLGRTEIIVVNRRLKWFTGSKTTACTRISAPFLPSIGTKGVTPWTL